MASDHVNSILCAADPGGSIAMLEGILRAADRHNLDAVAVVGNLDDREERFGNRSGMDLRTNREQEPLVSGLWPSEAARCG